MVQMEYVHEWRPLEFKKDINNTLKTLTANGNNIIEVQCSVHTNPPNWDTPVSYQAFIIYEWKLKKESN